MNREELQKLKEGILPALERAKSSTLEGAAMLDETSYQCDCCGRPASNDRNQWQAGLTLRGVIEKLHNVITTIEAWDLDINGKTIGKKKNG